MKGRKGMGRGRGEGRRRRVERKVGERKGIEGEEMRRTGRE